MPTLSASDYTTFLKFKAGAASTIKPAIQSRDNVAVSQSLINANILASQAAYVVTPTIDILGGNNASVQGPQVVQTRANPNALSTVSYAGTSGALGSSHFNRTGGLPTGFKGSQGTYTRLPQNAGWIQGRMLSSGQKRF
jgi:hypothetical protein